MNKKIIKVLLIILIIFIVSGCSNEGVKIKLNDNVSYILEVGQDDIDFTKYFIITSNKKNIKVTNDMLDLSQVDLLQEGTFIVTINYEEISLQASFFVQNKGNIEVQSLKIINNRSIEVGEELNLSFETTPTNIDVDVVWTSSNEEVATVSSEGILKALKEGTTEISVIVKDTPMIKNTVSIEVISKQEKNYVDLSDVFDQYNDYADWNFLVNFKVLIDNNESWNYNYFYEGYDYMFEYISYGEEKYNDYIIYNEETSSYDYYTQTTEDYQKYTEEDEDYHYYIDYVDYINIAELNSYNFIEKDGYYQADNPQLVAEHMLDSYEGDSWSYLYIEIKDGFISKVIALSNYLDSENNETYEYKYEITFTKNNEIKLDLSVLDSALSSDDKNTLSVFIDKNLSVGSGQIEYQSEDKATNYSADRGVQFLQADGEVIITSKKVINNVMAITLIVQTNTDKGMNVSIKVGDISILADDNEIVKVSKTSFNEFKTLTFSSNVSLSGIIKIVLTPLDTSKSMYIKSIAISNDDSSSSDTYMEVQEFNNDNISDSRLQAEILKVDEAIGLSSIGKYNALVVPIKFTNTTISNDDLNKLKEAFNGTEATTGWESVHSYYFKSSYNKLDITFDIVDVFQAKNTSSYYQKYNRQVVYEDKTTGYQTGEEILLLEVLAYLEPLLDLSKYDFNKDGTIDAVYLIYSEEVSYNNDDNFFWAYTSYYIAPNNENKTFDNLEAYNYLFAGFDFLDEDTATGFAYKEQIDDLLINASTYIHETGHLLGLDDYYDYESRMGSNEGLGGADMMDDTVGDHCSYSKIMLGWITPIICFESGTKGINSLEATGDVLMILLDCDGTYFSEYLLIDLYTNTGLNEMHSKQNNTALYLGEEFGVRIYHVSSDISNPYNDEYCSFTTYNNSTTNIVLIKLIEADGEKKFRSTNGYAGKDDLWQTGDVFSQMFKSYTRNDGALINFDLSFIDVNKEKAQITISFIEE